MPYSTLTAGIVGSLILGAALSGCAPYPVPTGPVESPPAAESAAATEPDSVLMETTEREVGYQDCLNRMSRIMSSSAGGGAATKIRVDGSNATVVNGGGLSVSLVITPDFSKAALSGAQGTTIIVTCSRSDRSMRIERTRG